MTTDGYEHSEYWYDYTRNDPNRENPFLKNDSRHRKVS